MSDVVTEFIERWKVIASDAGLTDDQRWPALREALATAVARLGSDAERLVTAIGYDNPAVTGLAFDVIDAANESPARSESQSRGGVLALLPVILVHRDGNAGLPRRAGYSSPVNRGISLICLIRSRSWAARSNSRASAASSISFSSTVRYSVRLSCSCDS